MAIGDRLRNIREKLGYTQRRAADRAGMRNQYLSNLENGRIANPSLDTLTKLAVAYDMGVDDLVGHVVPISEDQLPEGLRELLDDPDWSERLTDEWIDVLTKIQYQGRRLRTKREFLEAYLALSRILEGE